MIDRRLPLALVAFLLLVACGQIAPGAPTTQPTGTPELTPTASPTATVAVTGTPPATSSPTMGATAPPTPCDPYYGDCGGAGPTPPPAQGSTTVQAITFGDTGPYLAGSTRMALYTFDNDGAGSSACTGDCADTWPALTVAMGEEPSAGPGITGELGTIMRAGGSHHVTYNGAPLYYYAGDTQLYDVSGDGVNGAWHLARP